MKMYDVQIALEGVAEARAKWDTAFKRFNADVAYLMARLLNEAAVNHMSVEQVAKASGLTPKRVRALMRDHGLNPKHGRRLLANHAATALVENAALLSIEPHEMDLTSPLAYLPMGKDMRAEFLETEAAKGVKELPPDQLRVSDLVEVFQKAWHTADERGEEGRRTLAGICAVLEAQQAGL